MHQLPDHRLAEAYALEEALQAGEATAVFRGRAKASGDPVIVKVLRLAGTGVGNVHRLRFVKAVSALIKHAPSGVPPLKDAAWSQEAAVLIFAPVPGLRLTQLSQLTPAQVARILARTAAALRTLHEAQVAHLNLAPDNILVASAERVYLTGLGWGLIRMPTSGAAFAAPELRKAIDLAEPQRCDVFSLALLTATFFEAQVAFAEEEATVKLPEALGGKLQEVEALESVLARCLHQDPFERPAQVDELAQALEAAIPPGSLEEEGTARLEAPPPAPEEAGATVRLVEVPAPPSPGTREERDDSLPSSPSPQLSPEVPPAPVEPETAPRAEPAPSPAPPEAPAVASPMPPAPATPVPPAAAAAPGKKKGLRLALWLGGGGLLGVALIGAVLLFSRKPESPIPPTPTPRPTPVPATPTPLPSLSPLARILEQAQAALQMGDVRRAAELLASAPKEGASPEELALFQKLELQTRQQSREEALSALRAAFRAADLAALRRAVSSLEGGQGEEGLAPEDKHLLRQGREVVQVAKRLAQAEKLQQWETVLAEGQNLERLFPGTSQASQAQERAAKALEERARALEAAGELGQALATLQVLERYLPARPGLSQRLARLAEAQEKLAKLRQLLQQAQRLGQQGKPEQGLALLKDLPPEESAKEEVQTVKEELAQQLAKLDAGSPVVAPPAAGSKWEFAKGQVAKIEVRVSDDHGIARVTLFFRKKGEKSFRSLPMSKTSSGTYVGEVVPAVHGNEDLEFYVLAEDHSGHQGNLGTEQRPLEAKRKRGLFGL
jgi:serine/threonine protein kinase